MRERLTACLVLAGLALAAAAQPAGREPFNDGWTFVKDGTSRQVDLPHDWGVDGPFKQEYPGESGKLAWWGQAVYKKALTVTPEDLEKDIDLEIDGAMSHATVSVNGVDLGEMNRLLLQKVEELTLHIIELQKQIDELKAR